VLYPTKAPDSWLYGDGDDDDDGDNASWRDKPFITIITEEVPGELGGLSTGTYTHMVLNSRRANKKILLIGVKNFHTHLFLFTARNLHIKARQPASRPKSKPKTKVEPMACEKGFLCKIWKNYAWP